jgi:limonene-1,2-epoxide hydrolase
MKNLKLMIENSQLITNFYNALKAKDYKIMQESYLADAIFNDEVFTNLNGTEAGQMWEMLIKNGKDLELKFEIISSDDDYVNARWIAKYTFKKTDRLVINDIQAFFKIEDGKISQHTDSFDFYKWARQAFGLTGLLLGWTTFFKSKVQKNAMGSLEKYTKGK